MQSCTLDTLAEVVAWVEATCAGGHVVAAGIDTITEWNGGRSGWRPADHWLRETYPDVKKSVVALNSIYGAMAVNGASFLTLLRPRFHSDGTMITEAHPKVCYFAITGIVHAWPKRREDMTEWLLRELGIESPESGFGVNDHSFDAGVSILGALRGLNGDWTHDLHTESNESCGPRVQPFGPTHYWWPDPPAANA